MTYEQEEKRSETLTRILEAAKDVFAEKGFAGARVDEIARKANVNKATLYYHIGDKKALYAEAIHNVIGTASERLAKDIRRAKTPKDKIKTYLGTLTTTFDENPQLPRMMMREMASGGQDIPEIFFQDLFSIIRVLSGIIEEGKSQGVFIDTHPLLVHFMVIGATVIYKIFVPILLAAQHVPDNLKGIDKDVSGKIAKEIEKLILNAIKK